MEEKGNFDQITKGEESLVIKLKGYVYYLHKNKISWDSCGPRLVIEPIFFNEKYSYIVLSRPDIEVQERFKECIGKPLTFGVQKKYHTNFPLYKNDEFFVKLEKENVFHPHTERIKACEVVLEGRIIKEEVPYFDSYHIDKKSADEKNRSIFVTEAIHMMKKVD